MGTKVRLSMTLGIQRISWSITEFWSQGGCADKIRATAPG